LTRDRGKEMADHKRFSLATDIQVYFCHPQQPWQRGSNENTNGLLRQHLPKGMDLSDVHQNTLNAIARRLNERPREALNFETPANASANALRRSIETAAECRDRDPGLTDRVGR
jgi:IS30 family transposase